MQANPVIWFEIYVQDMARAKAFYEKVLGVSMAKLDSPVADTEMWTFGQGQKPMGANGTLVKMPGVPSGGNSTLVYFACEDCAVEASRVEAAGGKIFKPKFPIGPFGFIALALDAEHNMFGLHSMK